MRRGSAASQTAAFENTQTKGHTKNEHDEKREARQMCRAVSKGGGGMSNQTKADPCVAGMSFEERATVALGLIISIIGQTMASAKNRRKLHSAVGNIISGSEEMVCLDLIHAITRAGIDYDVSVAEITALQEESRKTLQEVARGAFAEPSGKAVAV